MEFIPIEHQEDYSKILEYINAYKNGVTSDAMISYGINYDKNYGVSMIDLRRIADRYPSNHALAQLLWNKGWRETYILSTLIDQPEKYTAESLKPKVATAPTFEVLEQLAYNLAWQMPFLDHFFTQVNDWDNTQMQYFLTKSTTYQLMKKTITAHDAWQRIKQYTFSDNTAILTVLQNLLLRITADDHTLHPEAIAYCQRYNTPTWHMLTEVVREYGVL